MSCHKEDELILLKLEGERVDLLTFPPACLPSHGQSFGGELEGTVAGEFANCPTANENQCFKGWGVTKEGGYYTSDNLKVVQVIFL